MPTRFRLRVLLLTLCLAGCDDPTVSDLLDADPPAAPAFAVATAFDPANCGRVEGRVTWTGALPQVPDFLYGVPRGDGHFDTRMMSNPNRPAVDPASRAVAGAVVYLRGVNAAAAKPWDHAPVRVELKDRQIVVRLGDRGPGRVGFVRRGDVVQMSSAEPVFHVIRGRGAAFFSHTFPDPDRPLTRTFDRPGRVELTSGAGYYWASADLFVDDHPYYALTDRDGRFVLDRVPAGGVELVVWMPGWVPARQERDPESGLVARMSYGPSVEVIRKISVEAGGSVSADVNVP